MLEVKDLKVSYGNIQAVKGVSFKVEDGKIVSLIGANGAGKTTIMHTISGLLKPESGSILFDDLQLTTLEADKIVSKGLIQVPERRRIFYDLTVEENLILGAYLRKDNIREDLENVFSLFPILRQRLHQPGGTLSGGEQQMLAMARALMAKPKILLLDEPSMGLSPLLVKEIFSIIHKINQQGVSILLVEQNANMALAICDYGYVLETGKIVLQGTGEQLSSDNNVKKAYLGG